MNQMLRVRSRQEADALPRADVARAEHGNPLYLASVQPDAKITIGRVTLNVSMLKKAVSR